MAFSAGCVANAGIARWSWTQRRLHWSQSIVAGGRNRRSAHTWHIGVYVKCVENRVPSLLSADIRRDASAVRLMRVTCILLLLQLAIPSKLISIIADEHGAGAIA